MANGLYGIFESTLITGRNFSFVSDKDLENGMLVHRGDIVSTIKGNEVYQAIVPTAASISRNERVYVIGNPAWSYDDSSIVNHNEDKYFIPAGKIFRVYSLNASDRFGIADYGIEGNPVDVGDYIRLLADSTKPESATALPANGFAARVIEVRDMGHEYWVGQLIDQRTRMIRVEVVRNG